MGFLRGPNELRFIIYSNPCAQTVSARLGREFADYCAGVVFHFENHPNQKASCGVAMQSSIKPPRVLLPM